MLDHEKLDVYKCSIQFAALSFRFIERLPRGHAHLSDQLRRAAMSIALNIAEGSGKKSRADRARYYAISRDSAMERGAIGDLLKLQGLADSKDLDEAKGLLVRIVGMLTKMCR